MIKKEDKDITIRYSLLMQGCFWAFLVGNFTNILGFIWITPGGIGLRSFINFILRPGLGLLFGKQLLEKPKYEDITIKNWFINACVVLGVFSVATICFFLNMRYEEEKNLCQKTEIYMENYGECLKSVNDKRFNFKKLL